MKRTIFITFLLLYSIFAFPVKLRNLTCEMQSVPINVDNGNPRFGWQLIPEYNGDIQAFYQIEISAGGQIVWNTGKVKSDQSQLITYRGKPLQNENKYSWTVKVWDVKGRLSGESSSFFYTAPEPVSLKAKWIGAISKEDAHLPVGRRDFSSPSFKTPEYKTIYDQINPLALKSILLRKSFHTSKEIAQAIIHISGLGHYNLSINGKNISDDIFTPAWSDYDKTVYYNSYFIDTLLNDNENVIGVTLGNGFYNAVGNRYRKLWISFGPPTLFFEMHICYKDGTTETIVSDESWKYAESPIVFNDIYGGEDYDAQLEQTGWNKPGFNESSGSPSGTASLPDLNHAAWKPVILQDAPAGTLRPQQITNVRKMKEYKVVSAEKNGAGYVFDMGQNLSGYPAIKVKGKRGQTIKLTVGELLNPETGGVSQTQSGGPHTYSYTLKGDEIEKWHPEFSYYGFRYIQVDTADILTSESDKPVILDIKSHFTYNSTPPRGHFECSNELFNKTHEIIKNAVRSNMQSVFTDCPHREKLGWLEETHLNGPGLLYNWDMTQFYPKIMQDMKDRQQPGGLIPTTVPEYVVFDESLDVFRDSPEWGIASIMLPWLYYKFYGDNLLIKNYFEVMKGYVDHMTSRSTDYIISHGLGDWYDYGEHRAGFSKNSPVEVSATAHYYYAVHLVSEAAEMLKKTDDEKKYRKLSDNIRDAFNTKFFDTQTKQYGTGSQFCNAIAIFMNIVKPQDKQAVMDNLKADIRKHGNRLTTGDIGNRYLFQALALNGENELMYLMHNHTDTPGYGFQINYGVTTLTEQWDPRKGASWNHFMMGQIDEWFFRSLAGIEPIKQGFKEFTIQPQPVGDLEWVKAEHETLYGNICVYWKRENGKFRLSLEVPGNTKAHVILPDGSKKTAVSGKYEFECKFIN